MADRPMSACASAPIQRGDSPRITDVVPDTYGRQVKMASNEPPAVKPKPRPKVTKKKSSGKKDAADASSDEETTDVGSSRIVDIAKKYIGLGERSDRSRLSSFFESHLDEEIDPVRTPWCAAFINAVLAEAGLATSGSNQGISFASYGTKVSEPRAGDIVVIRGGRSSRTHVGIYVGSTTRNGRKYIKLLGGNQSDHVQISSYPASRIIAIRRPT